MHKKKVLVSFSGGETSAYMCWYLKEHYSDYFEMIFVFANVGEENEETLIFANKVDKLLDLNLVWVEPLISKTRATKFTITDFKHAERTGINGNFEKMIAKYGIPNKQNSICTRELKERPITAYARSIGWKRQDYQTAIGIRADEVDRISVNRVKNNLIYPLVHADTSRATVNLFWSKQSFRLDIKGYQGNCKWCWKKSYRKLFTIYNESSNKFDFPLLMEEKYGNFTANLTIGRLNLPMTFFRSHKNVEYIRNSAAIGGFVLALDDRMNFDVQSKLDFETDCGSSCEVFQ